MTALLALVYLMVAAAGSPDLPSGPELLEKTLAYHDPDGSWMDQRVELQIETGYADGRKRLRVATVDYVGSDYRDRVEQEGHVLEQEIRGGECLLLLDGSSEFDAAMAEELNFNCERTEMYRNYISYLWGLPMKFGDAGARIADTVGTREFQGKQVFDLKISYDPEVGTDVWHAYIDPESGRMIGYAFYKTPAEERGEYIVLEGEVVVGNTRVPAARSWYTIPDDEFLGTDTLLAGKILEMESR